MLKSVTNLDKEFLPGNSSLGKQFLKSFSNNMLVVIIISTVNKPTNEYVYSKFLYIKICCLGVL